LVCSFHTAWLEAVNSGAATSWTPTRRICCTQCDKSPSLLPKGRSLSRTTKWKGRAVAQAPSARSLTTESRVRSQASRLSEWRWQRFVPTHFGTAHCTDAADSTSPVTDAM
jgi:hypothetical protein